MQHINGVWIKGLGESHLLYDPVTGLAQGKFSAASLSQAEHALAAATEASMTWARTSLEARISIINRFALLLNDARDRVARAISEETAKPLWETQAEVTTMINKAAISIEAYHQRTGEIRRDFPGYVSVTRHRPLGVMLVLGPFNFPGHLPNGYIMPALLAGNTLVFKPSEYTPKTATIMTELWEEAGLPAGVLNLVLGDGHLGSFLVTHPQTRGIFFTGSYRTGKAIHALCGGYPEKLLALEMGGNNPLIVWDVADIKAAVYTIIQSSFISAGQRCTCAKRLILPSGVQGEQIINTLISAIQKIRVGDWRLTPEPFMGGVISAAAAKTWLALQDSWLSQGGKPLLRMTQLKGNTGLLSPGLIDVTESISLADEECFGPLLSVIRVSGIEAAFKKANDTEYGLVAGLLSDDPALYEAFSHTVRAGVLNWNRPTTGATSVAPFGGLGHSGNFRPAGYYTADHCAYPVASNQTERLKQSDTLLPGLS